MTANHSRNRREQRHIDAEARQASRRARKNADEDPTSMAHDQLSKLNYRLGENQGAKRERAKLAKLIGKEAK